MSNEGHCQAASGSWVQNRTSGARGHQRRAVYIWEDTGNRVLMEWYWSSHWIYLLSSNTWHTWYAYTLCQKRQPILMLAFMHTFQCCFFWRSALKLGDTILTSLYIISQVQKTWAHQIGIGLPTIPELVGMSHKESRDLICPYWGSHMSRIEVLLVM